MPFLDSALEHIDKLPKDDPFRQVLIYLVTHAVGVHNAKSWEHLEAHLSARGMSMDKKQFQQTILKESRQGPVFIGSTDSGSARGYFLIANAIDADAMRSFYEKRIAAEIANLGKLNRLCEQVGWGPSQPQLI